MKRNLTILTLTCVALAGCDKASAPDDGADDGSEETEGAGEETTAGESSNLSCKEPGASRDCTTEDGEQGVQFCDDSYASGAEVLQWHECLTSIVCTPGDSNDCGIPGGGGGDGSTGEDPGSTIWEHCGLYGGVPDWDTNQDEWGGCNTPLVLSFDGQPARMTAAGAATFDLDGVGGCITTDWPGAATPWLALDRDGNGSIDSGRELFGSGTRLSNGRRAPHGFAALADLDDNGDGRIDLHDEAFGQLVLWGDHDGDRRSTFAETELLAHRQILGIELGYRIDRQCDDRGNCGVERASFRFIDEHGAVRTGEVVDLHLACH
ncbi:MAG: calcium-binding protein [Deltaproteobacteria bacterium]|nr:calcium-binding protein [Deltaproteobacteria bacterium]